MPLNGARAEEQLCADLGIRAPFGREVCDLHLLVEYGDNECPYGVAAYPIVKDLQARMGDRLRFVFVSQLSDLDLAPARRAGRRSR